ncbi:hypothetical protein CSUI_008712 [Cystoisospora suis]|uniref:Uncharacterized protein n=1 Tax=Cystoisospora suis TaxID=483139 RepID=A0A2C6KIT3_9APIC|nr:hypothetical protein CSUI_008712 [Cystoisospora suis]
MVVLPHCLYTPPRGPSQLRRRRREPFNPFLSSSSSFLGPPDLLLPLYSSHSSHAFLGIETEEEEEDSGKE